MKEINKDEMYGNLSAFLKAKGIELKEGTYSKRIQQGCNLLTDAVNLAQDGLERAKRKADQKLEQMRQVIHERTAPKAAASAPPPPPKPSAQGGRRKRSKRSRPPVGKTAPSRRRRAKS